MKAGALRRTHPAYDWQTIHRYRALFEGGQCFRHHIHQMLPKHDVEPPDVYKRRCESATYTNYCGSIAGYFASWLFSSPLQISPDSSTVEADAPIDPFWAQFKEDCDGNGTDFENYLRERFVESLIGRSSYWRVKFPRHPEGETVSDRARWEALGLGRAMLHTVGAKELTNWRTDSQGEFMWALEHSHHQFIRDFADGSERIKETWTLWRRPDQVPEGEPPHRRWAVEYDSDKTLQDADDVPEVTDDDPPADQVEGIPIVCLEMPPELWLMNHLADPQLEIFRKTAALGWAIDRTCYAMPVFYLKNRKQPPTKAMGAGYYMILGAGDKLEWPAPPSAPFATIQAYIASRKDEMYRVAGQMAQGIDNNASAVGRSGDSKAADNRATEIVLRAYGALVREAAERTLNIIAIGRGESIRWRVAGMDHYHVTDGETLTAMMAQSQSVPIPSVTARREQTKRLVRGQMPDLDEAKLNAIDAEIDAAPLAAFAPPAVKAAKPQPESEPDAQPIAPAAEEKPDDTQTEQAGA